jgi:hypothetical protein
MNIRLPALSQYSAVRGFDDVSTLNIHRSKTPYMAAFNVSSSLIHAVQTLNEFGVSLQRARILPDIGRVLEPETRLYRVEPYLDGIHASNCGYSPVRVTINVREDNRLRRFLPLLAIGLPPIEAIRGWTQGRVSPETPWDVDNPSDPYTPLTGYHRYYLEPGSMPEDWTNKITPAERLALQICQRFQQLRDAGEPPQQIADRMLIVGGTGFEERDNPLAGLIVTSDASLISQIGTVLELVEVFLTQAMLTIAGGDVLGGFDFVIPFEPPEGREIALKLDQNSAADKVARWFNAYPHRSISTIHEQYEQRLSLDAAPAPTRWSANDPGIRQITERIANWYRNGSVKLEEWDRDGSLLKYKLPTEPLDADDMLSLARAYLPEFIPNYPRQVFVSGGMNIEGVLLGLISYWLENGTLLGMEYSDWELFSLEQQVILCGLLVQRKSRNDQCAMFEAALRLLIDEGIKTWMENFRKEKIPLDRADCASPLSQLGFCMPLGGIATLHAPSLKIRIPRDYTCDPEAKVIESKLRILENLFLPAHIPVQHIWDYDWVKLGETAYLKSILNPVNPDLIPIGVKLYDAYD